MSIDQSHRQHALSTNFKAPPTIFRSITRGERTDNFGFSLWQQGLAHKLHQFATKRIAVITLSGFVILIFRSYWIATLMQAMAASTSLRLSLRPYWAHYQRSVWSTLPTVNPSTFLTWAKWNLLIASSSSILRLIDLLQKIAATNTAPSYLAP